jgi:hypothetical protein
MSIPNYLIVSNYSMMHDIRRYMEKSSPRLRSTPILVVWDPSSSSTSFPWSHDQSSHEDRRVSQSLSVRTMHKLHVQCKVYGCQLEQWAYYAAPLQWLCSVLTHSSINPSWCPWVMEKILVYILDSPSLHGQFMGPIARHLRMSFLKACVHLYIKHVTPGL